MKKKVKKNTKKKSPSLKEGNAFYLSGRTSKFDPIDDEDRYYMEMIDKSDIDDWEIIPNYKGFLKQSQEAARNFLRKDARVSLRLSGYDLEKVKKEASIEGIPYQTFISSIIHKYINGVLVDVRK